MDSKLPVEHIEKGQDAPTKVFDATGNAVQVDYSGAHTKTSPEEIRLVKKLDRWIMVSRP